MPMAGARSYAETPHCRRVRRDRSHPRPSVRAGRPRRPTSASTQSVRSTRSSSECDGAISGTRIPGSVPSPKSASARVAITPAEGDQPDPHAGPPRHEGCRLDIAGLGSDFTMTRRLFSPTSAGFHSTARSATAEKAGPARDGQGSTAFRSASGWASTIAELETILTGTAMPARSISPAPARRRGAGPAYSFRPRSRSSSSDAVDAGRYANGDFGRWRRRRPRLGGAERRRESRPHRSSGRPKGAHAPLRPRRLRRPGWRASHQPLLFQKRRHLRQQLG